MNFTVENSKKNFKIINIISWAIPLAVALVIGVREKIDLGAWTKVIPHIIGLLNSTTSITLLIAFFQVKKGNIVQHRNFMLLSFVQGALFLLLYICYHISNESTHYGNEGILKYTYFFLLISHILLSIVVVRFVLLAMFYALSNQISEHLKVVKWAFPIWLYVSISGVIVYLMIRPFYN